MPEKNPTYYKCIKIQCVKDYGLVKSTQNFKQYKTEMALVFRKEREREFQAYFCEDTNTGEKKSLLGEIISKQVVSIVQYP